MGISFEQFRSRIRSHDNFVKIKDVSSRFKDRFWNIMLMTFYLNVFYLLTLKTSCYTIQNVESSDVLVYTNDVLQCLYSIAYKTANDVEENPGPSIFDIIDSMIIVSETTVKEMKHSLVKMLVSNV